MQFHVEQSKSAYSSVLNSELLSANNPPVSSRRSRSRDTEHKDELCKAITANPILIVIGETGCGKTSQIPLYLSELGYTQKGRVICTQAYNNPSSTPPSIEGVSYVSDNTLVREFVNDITSIDTISALVIDDVHERTIATDLLLALFKQHKVNDQFRLILTSATVDIASKVSHYFNDCPIFTIPGRTFPVEVFHSQMDESDAVVAAVKTVQYILTITSTGNMMIFLATNEECDRFQQALQDHSLDLVVHLITNSSIVYGEDEKGLQRHCYLVATTMSEASLPSFCGITTVIDTGYYQQDGAIARISQQSAKHRASHAGKSEAGKCFRMYTEGTFANNMPEVTVPEIQRKNLTNTVLQMKALGIDNTSAFEFMDPNAASIIQAVKTLHDQGAVDSEGNLTASGRELVSTI